MQSLAESSQRDFESAIRKGTVVSRDQELAYASFAPHERMDLDKNDHDKNWSRMLKQTQRQNTPRKTTSYLILPPNAQKSVRDVSDILKRTWRRPVTKRKRCRLEEAGLMPSSSIATVLGPASA